MMNVRSEQSSGNKRTQNVGKKQIGDRLKLVAGGLVSCDLYAEFAKVFDRPPNFGARGAEFFCDALTADDHGSVVAQQANDAAETRICRAVWGGSMRVGTERAIGRLCGNVREMNIPSEDADNRDASS